MPPNLDPPVVTVQGGKIRGFRDGKTTVFLGVPYAEAERFELPKPVTPWEGVKSAQAWGPVCPIVNMTEPGIDEFVFPHRYWVENEHCQVLNIWTQGLSRTAGKPVMVWMHGGGFTNGSSMEAYAYDGKNLSEYGDVVVVSMNHRLNILGTLDLSAYGSQYARSRYTGTADLVASLQWVHDNIENFGGDPGNVTLFGQSGGGSKAARMMHTPSAKGLFHNVICESGGGEVLANEEPAKNLENLHLIAAETIKNLNLTGDQIDKLKTVPYSDLIAAGDAALKTAAKETGAQRLMWNVYADDQYITREFCDWSSSIPLMFGNVFSEFMGNLVSGEDKNSWTQQDVENHLTARYGDKKDAVVSTFKEAFPDKKLQDVLFFAVPNNAALGAKREAGNAPVYNYLFTYEYPVNNGITAFHTSELAFVFHNLSEPQVRISTGDAPAGYALQDRVSRAWINFAHTGNPSQPGLEWKPYAQEDPQTMVFDIVSGCRNLHYDKFHALMPDQGFFFRRR
ncbi:MAG TPA: carboxylesterase family protein [Terracidiphilus sp.]|nr:carboxylesterase family protein [Terracidiphilus sp.]